MLWTFVLLILGIVYYFINNAYEDNGNQQVDPTERITDRTEGNSSVALEDDLDRPEAPAGQNVLPDAQSDDGVLPPPEPVITFVSSSNSTHLYRVSNVDSLDVELKIVGDQCWVWAKEKDADGKEIEQKTYRNGEMPVFKTSEGLWLRFGKPLAVEVKVNGETISIPETVNPINLQIELSQT